MTVYPFPPRDDVDETELAVDRAIRHEEEVERSDGTPNFDARNDGTYLVEFPAAYTLFEVSHVRADRDGGIGAEVKVRYTAPGLTKIISQSRLSLTGTRARTELAKHLEKRMAGQKIDWSDLVEQAAVLCLDRYRRGDPATLLRDALAPSSDPWLLRPLLRDGQPAILFGDGGNGKSTIALAMAATLQTGRADILGMTPSATRNVLYLDWEWESWEHRARLRSLVEGPEPAIAYRRCFGPLVDQLDAVREDIRQFGTQFVMVDSAAAACKGKPEDAEVALDFYNGLRSLNVGSLVICHTTKSGENKERPFGSTFFHNSARTTWLIEKQQGIGEHVLSVGLFNKKANSGPLAAPLAFDIEFPDNEETGRTRIIRRDVRDNAELSAKGGVSLKYRMKHLLQKAPLTYHAICQELDAEDRAVRQAVQRDGGKTFVARLDGGGVMKVWRVASEERVG